MYACCKVCGRNMNNKGYSTIGNQKVCSIRCAADVIAEENDKCGNCGSPVWEDDYYAVQGTYCCCPKCRDALKNADAIPLKTKPKKSNLKTGKKVIKKKKNQFAEPGMQVGGTNVAMGPRDWDTNDIDFGPGDSNVDGNYYHGGFGNNNAKKSTSSKANNYLKNDYNNYDDQPKVNRYKSQKNVDYNYNYNDEDDDDEEEDAYGDINDQNYLNQYGDHQIIQKNESLAVEQMRGSKIPDSANRPKNESHSVVHHGDDIKCSYCGFVIKDGVHCFVDNYGKKFDTDECFSNYFQGIPRPKFG